MDSYLEMEPNPPSACRAYSVLYVQLHCPRFRHGSFDLSCELTKSAPELTLGQQPVLLRYVIQRHGQENSSAGYSDSHNDTKRTACLYSKV